MFPFSWQPRSWMSPPTTNPDPMMQSMWTPTASTVLPAHGIAGQFCGGDPQVNQQAQSQAQISALQHQNALLNQQLATQAASHIHQLQQVLRPSSSVPNPQTPAPSEPPQPTVQPEVKTTTPPPVHTDEMLQKLRTDCKAGMENILQKFHDSSHPPKLYRIPIIPSQPLIQRPTTFQHSTITCPCSSLSLTSPTAGPTTVRINDLSPLTAVQLVDVPGRLIPCTAIDSLLGHHEKVLSGYAQCRDLVYTISTILGCRLLYGWKSHSYASSQDDYRYGWSYSKDTNQDRDQQHDWKSGQRGRWG